MKTWKDLLYPRCTGAHPVLLVGVYMAMWLVMGKLLKNEFWSLHRALTMYAMMILFPSVIVGVLTIRLKERYPWLDGCPWQAALFAALISAGVLAVGGSWTVAVPFGAAFAAFSHFRQRNDAREPKGMSGG